MLYALFLLSFVSARRVPLNFGQTHTIEPDQSGTLVARTVPVGLLPSRAVTVWATPTLVQTRRNPSGGWKDEEVLAPDVTELDTLLELAQLTSNAYKTPGHKDWYDLPNWNASVPIGQDDPGLRGHVFASTDESTVVLSVKGTTLPFTGPTSGEDKRNDNVLFSCCCAHSVCGCASKGHQCDRSCLESALAEESLFYSYAVNLYNNVTFLYPHATIWITGHSLGGGLAALLGATFGAPTVAYSSPGERRAARLLHLPETAPIIHVLHTADPVSYGACGTCARAGYSLETRCHLGRVIEFDTVGRFGWRQDVRMHPMRIVLDKVLGAGGLWPDGDADEKGAFGAWRTVPLARAEVDCVDCYSWTFNDSAPLIIAQHGQQ